MVNQNDVSGALGGILGELEEKFKLAKDARIQFEAQWYRNMAFYQGRHWVVYNKRSKKLIDLAEEPSWRVRLTTNHVLSFVQTKVAMLLKNRPLFNVMSMTDDSNDRESSKLAQQLLDYFWRKSNVLEELRRFVHHGIIFGSGFLKAFWDTDRGPRVLDPSVEEEDIDPENPPIVALGDVSVKAISPFEIYPAPNKSDPFLRELPWLIHAYRVPVKDFEAKWGISEMGETGEDGLEEQYRNLVNSTGNPDGDLTNTPGMEDEAFVVVKEYWERPTAEVPLGKFIVFTRSNLLHIGALPYGEDLPFSKFDDIFIPDRFWGGSTVEQLLPLQTEYNRNRSQLLENRNLMGNPKLVAPRESIKDKEFLTSEPGEIIYYTALQGVPPPSVLPMPSPPSYIIHQEETILRDMQIVSGISDVNLRSSPPAGLESGRALALLAEKDETRMSPTIQSFEGSLAAIGSVVLDIVRNFYAGERTIRVVGSDNMARVVRMHGEDVGVPEDIDVTIGQGLGFSRFARIELLLEMYDRGLMRDPNKLLGLLEFGDDKAIYEEQNIDKNNAMVENLMMSQGQPVNDPLSIDDHVIHLEIHRKYIKGDEFRKLPPEIQEILINHYSLTNELVQQQFQQMAEQQAEQGQERQ